MVVAHSLFTDKDIALFRRGEHFRLYEKLGSHLITLDEEEGVYFAVWAPHATSVSVVGTFNNWRKQAHPLLQRWDDSGIWEGFVPKLTKGTVYKYAIRTPDGKDIEKGDPYARKWETPPKTASIVWQTAYDWKDKAWLKGRKRFKERAPISVYEVHVGSWRKPDETQKDVFYTYRELAETLVPYVHDMGFTHVELMPVMEHPYYPSWGYQQTGYYAPSSRYGNPEDLMFLVDAFHEVGVGVYLDWVPSHFPHDAHGLFRFDGTHLYEYADPREGYHPDWNSYIFNYSKPEVRSFLVSNALFWLEQFHADGLRVDAVASILFKDYSRKAGEWIPNKYGGRENLEAFSLLQVLNTAVQQAFPDVQMIAEESTTQPLISHPVAKGGLGFDMKWMMGWMNDTLRFFKREALHRRFHHNEITFSLSYAFTEHFMLPLSHDEVVHGKGTLLTRMPGDEWQRFANLRLMYAYMFAHPGTKLLFMGADIGQYDEWNHYKQLSWHLLQYDPHKGIQKLLKQLNHLYTTQSALYHHSFSPAGFEWLSVHDAERSVIAFARKSDTPSETLLIVCNCTPTPHAQYPISALPNTTWVEILNTDSKIYWGSGMTSEKPVTTNADGTLYISLPPLATVYYKQQPKPATPKTKTKK
jgi:1,4-alpha-glucan branching enzyme